MKISELKQIIDHVLETDGDVPIQLYDYFYEDEMWVELYHGRFLFGTGEKPKFDHRPLEVIQEENRVRAEEAYARRNARLGGLLP